MTGMLSRLFPKAIDNNFPGRKIALYAFYVIAAITVARSLAHVFLPDGGAQSIATIPLDRYSQGGSEAVIFLFALWGLAQLMLALVYVVSLVRYRALIPFLYLLFILEYAGRAGIGMMKTLETTATAPGAVANVPAIVLGCILLALSLYPPRAQKPAG